MKIFIFRESEIKDLNPIILKEIGLGGTETSFLLLSISLSKNNKIKVCCPTKTNYKEDNLEYINFLNYNQVFNEIEDFKPDFLIVVGNPNILFKNKFEKYKVIFWQHNHPLEIKHFPVNSLFSRDNLKVVFPSPEAAEFSKKYYNNFNKIFGIYNSIRDEFINSNKSKKIKNKICYISSFSRAKGLLEFLNSSKNLKEFDLYAIGDFDLYGDFDSKFSFECENLFEENNVRRLGKLKSEELAKEISSSELCIVNPIIGNKETCCICALESISVGTPVVAGGKSIIDPIIEKCGISNINNLEDTIKKFMNEKEKREQIVKNSETWIKQFSKENISLIWEKFLMES